MDAGTEKILDSLKAQAEDKIKGMSLPIPEKPTTIDNLQMPPELSKMEDNLLGDLYDKFTSALQYSHYCEELINAELDLAQYNYDLAMNIRLSTTEEARKDIMNAKIVATDPELKKWAEVINVLKIQSRLTKGLTKGYKGAVRRIQSEKIGRASDRKHLGFGS